jgi:ribosome-binding protein aMBF1 (putative translation factor)
VHDPNLALPQASDPKVALALKLVGARSALPRRPVEPVPAYHDDPAVDKQGRRLLKGLGLAVKLQRVERGWSQERLGSNSGLDRTYVGCIERGERNLGIANVALLARALQVSAAELLAEAERLAALLADDDA